MPEPTTSQSEQSDGTRLVQIVKRRGDILRVNRGVTPIVELVLQAHERVISIVLKEQVLIHGDRKTVDWSWTAYIEVTL